MVYNTVNQWLLIRGQSTGELTSRPLYMCHPFFMKVDVLERKEPDSAYLHLHMCPIISQKDMGLWKCASFLRALDFTSSIKVESDLLWDNRSLSAEAAIFIHRIRYLFGVSAGSCELWHLSAEMIDAVLFPLSKIYLCCWTVDKRA